MLFRWKTKGRSSRRGQITKLSPSPTKAPPSPKGGRLLVDAPLAANGRRSSAGEHLPGEQRSSQEIPEQQVAAAPVAPRETAVLDGLEALPRPYKPIVRVVEGFITSPSTEWEGREVGRWFRLRRRLGQERIAAGGAAASTSVRLMGSVSCLGVRKQSSPWLKT